MKNLIKISSKICGILLAVLGFSALATSCMKYGMPVEYGCPSADFFIDGKITSEKTDSAIEGLKVRWLGGVNSNERPIDSVFTDENGKFNFNHLREFPVSSYSLDIQDIDGTENGAFNDTTINVTINRNEYQGGDGRWYDGEYRKSFDIKLKPKK